MNTIKIYFDEDGSIKELKKDFQLYQGQYHDKLISVYVPTSVLTPDFSVVNEQGQTVSDYTASPTVKIGMKYVARNGAIKQSKNYYMNKVKDLTQNGVEYSLFERKLPKEFTTYVGLDENAPKVVVNVVNVSLEDEPTVLSVITTQECRLDVMPSAELGRASEEVIEPTELEFVTAEINAIKDFLPTKQDKTDYSLLTAEKTIVGAINANLEQIETNKTNTEENASEISALRNEIGDLTSRFEQQETLVGQMAGNELPSDNELNDFVFETAHRPVEVGDVVIFMLEGDTAYKFTYSMDGWISYVVTDMAKADNNTFGLISGNYFVGAYDNVLVDISNGRIINIWVKDRNEEYRNLREYLNSTHQTITRILDGSNGTSVAKSLRAIADNLGNDIVATYLTKTVGASKQYVTDYAMPRVFSTVHYISKDGYIDTVPTTEIEDLDIGGVQFVAETDSIGDTQVFQLTKTLADKFDLSISNMYENKIYISALQNCSVQFKLTTEYKKPGEEAQTLNVELTNLYTLVQEEITQVKFSNPFTYLNTDKVELVSGDQIIQTLEIKTTVATPMTFYVISNSTYPSYFVLTSQSYYPSYGGTVVDINDVNQTELSFNSDPQEQITANATAISELQNDVADISDNVDDALSSASSALSTAEEAKNTAEEALSSVLEGSGTKIYVNNTLSARQELTGNIQEQFGAITEKIPEQATASNQLADKDFVNSSINAIAAFYITYNAQGDAFPSKSALESATTVYSGGEVRVPTRNDYCLVLEDENNNNASTRYVYAGEPGEGQWEFQFVVNATAFTSEQVNAINSGITSALVGKITANETAIASKADKTNTSQTISASVLNLAGNGGLVIKDNYTQTDNQLRIYMDGSKHAYLFLSGSKADDGLFINKRLSVKDLLHIDGDKIHFSATGTKGYITYKAGTDTFTI